MTAGRFGILPFVLASLLWSCAVGLEFVAVVDNPDYAYANGMKFLERGEWENALAEFERARSLQADHVPAMIGIALVEAHRGHSDAAFLVLESARKLNGVQTQVGLIRVLTILKPADWLRRAEQAFAKGMETLPHDATLFYFMGMAYRDVFAFEKAASLFRRVLLLREGYEEEAFGELRRIERIQRAKPRSAVGRVIAVKDRATRGEMAALLMEEFQIERLFERQGFRARRRPPLAFPVITDLDGFPYRRQIEQLTPYQLRGLGVFPDQTFSPTAAVHRADIAVLLEDILARVMGRDLLAVKVGRGGSPFRDLDSIHYAYQAATGLTRMGIMEAPGDRFGPEQPVSGAEVLLILKRLAELLGL